MAIVVFAGLRSPKSSSTEKVCVAGDSARKREPLLDVSCENVVLKRKIYSGMSRSSRDNGCEMRRELFEDCPLIKSRIRAAPHGHFPIAIRLLREPFDDVIAILSFIHERLEGPAGIAAAAHVHQCVNVSMLRKIHRPIRVAVTDVRRESENDGERVLLGVRLKNRGVERYAIAHGYLHCPAQVGDRSNRCSRLARHALIRSGAQTQRRKQNHSMHNLNSSHPTLPRRSSGQHFEHNRSSTRMVSRK